MESGGGWDGQDEWVGGRREERKDGGASGASLAFLVSTICP